MVYLNPLQMLLIDIAYFFFRLVFFCIDFLAFIVFIEYLRWHIFHLISFLVMAVA